jgi:hypothetical protein
VQQPRTLDAHDRVILAGRIDHLYTTVGDVARPAVAGDHHPANFRVALELDVLRAMSCGFSMIQSGTRTPRK